MKSILLAAVTTLAATAALSSGALAQGSLSGSTSTPRHGASPSAPGQLGIAPQRRHHRGNHHQRNGSSWGFWGYGGDGDGYVDTIPMSDEPGYFSQGGKVTFDGTKPVYDYDRSYPYEWHRGEAASDRPASASLQCQVQYVLDEASARDVPVRVCR